MKKLALVMVLMALSTPSFAHSITNVTNVSKVTQHDNNALDYGVFADVVLYEAKNLELGIHSTYAYQDNESRVYVGGKYYFNRATYQKK